MVANKARLSVSRFCRRREDTCERQPRTTTRARCPFSAYVILALVEDLIVLADRCQEDDGGDILETVDPLPPLGALATHIYHPGHSRRSLSAVSLFLFPCGAEKLPEDDFGKMEGVLDDARRGDPDPQDVLQGGHVRRGRDSVQVIQVAGRWRRR